MVINKYLAELVGTFILVLIGSMSIIAAGAIGSPLLTVPFGFGLGMLAAIYAVGHVSNGYFNPAVTLGMFLDGRISPTDLIGYWIGQFSGGLLAALTLALATSRDAVASTVTIFPSVGLGIVSELALTTVFVLVILAVTRTAPAVSGIVISLTLVAVHFAGLPFSGASVNPARSFAPAVVGGNLAGLWVYHIFPLLGAGIAWGLWQFFRPDVRQIVIGREEAPEPASGQPADTVEVPPTETPEADTSSEPGSEPTA